MVEQSSSSNAVEGIALYTGLLLAPSESFQDRQTDKHTDIAAHRLNQQRGRLSQNAFHTVSEFRRGTLSVKDTGPTNRRTDSLVSYKGLEGTVRSTSNLLAPVEGFGLGFFLPFRTTILCVQYLPW